MATDAALLAAVDLAIEYRLGKIAAGEFLSISFGGQSFSNYTLAELYDIRKHLKAQVSGNDIDGTNYQGGVRIMKLKPGGMD